jgi:hypothetical protein
VQIARIWSVDAWVLTSRGQLKTVASQPPLIWAFAEWEEDVEKRPTTTMSAMRTLRMNLREVERQVGHVACQVTDNPPK